MSRWRVFRFAGFIAPPAWYAGPRYEINRTDYSCQMFSTWRQAYQHALTRARQESAQNDWNPEPVRTSG